MKKTITLKKGLNLNLEGAVTDMTPVSVNASSVAVIPDDFPGMTVKLDVAPGDKVKVGTPLLHDKSNEAIKLISPVAGTVMEIVRGQRRKIERVVVDTDKDNPSEALTFATDSDIRTLLMESGLWAMMRQRPYDIVPDPAAKPRDIFVTAFDSAPLAIDFNPAGKTVETAKAVAALQTLTSGHIYISVDAASGFPEIPGAVTIGFNRLHPAGNAGVQIAAIAPVNKGETVWTLSAETLWRIGSLLTTGKPDTSATCAVTGSEVVKPRIVKTVIGADMADILTGEIKQPETGLRVISGNVLTGIPVGSDGYLRYPYTQVTVIPEGDTADEFMGWASVSPSKMSESRSFPGHFLSRAFRPDARINGGRRAMIMSGVYDKVFPMDILPEYLIKAIISRDIDKLEALGIYEVAPEDFRLADYADPSKLELQKIVREGLDYLRKEV